MSNKPFSERLPVIAFIGAIAVLGFTYGYLAHRRGWFPHAWIAKAEEGFRALREEVGGTRPWYYFESQATQRTALLRPEAMEPGPTLVAFVGADDHQFIQVIAADGDVINEWRVDWFDLWPNADHLDEELRPKELPGAIGHGALLLADGGVVFQHDACGMVRLDACGHIVWRLPLRTHHSLHLDDEGDIWSSIRHTRKEPNPEYPTYRPPFDEYTIVEISPDGQLLQEISVFDLLRENGLTGLLYLSTWHDNTVDIGGDTLHLNDVELFPASMKPGTFRHGDVMVSLRRINAVVVFDLATRKVRHLSMAGFVRQHDPDFVDGDTISVFDNNHVGSRADGVQSRVVLENAATGEQRIAFTGTPERPFFTDIMGKHQWLPNGNLLLVESTQGRVIEVDPEGRPVWQFVNLLGDGLAGAVAEGIRLAPTFTAEFFAAQRAACGRPLSEAPARVPDP